MAATVKDLVHVGDVRRVSLDAEVHEGDFKLEQFADLNLGALLLDNLVSVLFEKTEDVELPAKVAHDGLVLVVALRCELRQLLHQRDEDVFDVNVDIEVRGGVKELLQRLQMILIGEGLDNTLHKVLLGEGIFADDDDVEDARQHNLLVDVVCDAFETAQSDDILTNGDTELVPFNLSLLSVFVRGKMLKTHPEAVHLRHVLKNELDGVVDVAASPLILVIFVWQNIFHHLEEIVSQEESSGRLLHSLHHVE